MIKATVIIMMTVSANRAATSVAPEAGTGALLEHATVAFSKCSSNSKMKPPVALNNPTGM